MDGNAGYGGEERLGGVCTGLVRLIWRAFDPRPTSFIFWLNMAHLASSSVLLQG